MGPSFDVIPLRLGNITIKQRMANHGEEHGHHPTQPHSLRFDGRGRLRMAKQGNKKVEVETEVEVEVEKEVAIENLLALALG